MPTPKHILFVIPTYIESSVQDFFNYAICQVNQAEALASMGYRVSVITRFGENHEVAKNGVQYFFVNDQKKPRLKRWGSSKRFLKEIENIHADIVHFHGFIFPIFLSQLIRMVGPNTKVLAEYHSDPIFRLMKRQQKRALAKADRLIFANEKAAKLWTSTFAFPGNRAQVSIECAPSSKYMNRKEARKISGFTGSPIFLWNSRLISRRDPLTVIHGYEQFLINDDYPDSHFYWMIPDWEDELLEKLKNKVASSNVLSASTTIIEGRKAHRELAPYFNSADYIVSGSLEDGYGYGIADGMSCGAIPIATDISTFRYITHNGAYGVLWKPGDKASLTEMMTQCVKESYHQIEEASNAVKEYFESHLSKDAQARQLDKIYSELY